MTYHVIARPYFSSLCPAPIQSGKYINCPPFPLVGLCMWGEGSLPPIHRPTGGGGEAVEEPALRLALFIRTLSDFTFLHGPRHMYWSGRCLYEGGMSSMGPSFVRATNICTQTIYPGIRVHIRRWARIAIYNRIFARSIVTRCRGVRGVFLP